MNITKGILCVTVRSPCRHSAAVEKRGSREVHCVELQSHSLQQVELEVVSGTIASRGASEILRRLRIMQGRSGLWNTWIAQENKLKACSHRKDTLYTSTRSHYESFVRKQPHGLRVTMSWGESTWVTVQSMRSPQSYDSKWVIASQNESVSYTVTCCSHKMSHESVP
jgi:hypothetical protein